MLWFPKVAASNTPSHLTPLTAPQCTHTNTWNLSWTYAVAVEKRDAGLQSGLSEAIHLQDARLQTPAKQPGPGTVCSSSQAGFIQPNAGPAHIHLTNKKFGLTLSQNVVHTQLEGTILKRLY
jgi:hypothetical protein